MQVAIMQPTYLPWVGYFAMMAKVDLFVLLDDVQFAKRSWQQRNRIKGGQGELWLTLPVLTKGKREQHINEVEIMQEPSSLLKHVKTIEASYKKAPFYSDYSQPCFDILLKKHRLLSDLTVELIQWLASCFNIQTPLCLASTLTVSGSKASRLVSICQAAKATHYLAAPGSENYLLESESFEAAKIPLQYFQYTPQKYNQLHGEFIPYLSALDLLFNEGPNSLSILMGGIHD